MWPPDRREQTSNRGLRHHLIHNKITGQLCGFWVYDATLEETQEAKCRMPEEKSNTQQLPQTTHKRTPNISHRIVERII
jgi:hypothetical protein